MKIIKISLGGFVLMVLFSLFFFKEVYALNAPNFPSCVNPEGTVVASYSNGVHGVSGDTRTFTGEDIVYSQPNNNYLQCLCGSPESFQTNWLDASQFSQADITSLEAQGWHYVADGSNWGLKNAPYMTLNIPFVCSNRGGGNGGSSNGGSNNGGTGGGGQILGSAASTVSGSVLGLANTGNMTLIVSVLFISVFALLYSCLLRKEKN